MNYDDVLVFIEGGKYINTKPFRSHKIDPEKYREYEEEEGRMNELFKADCKQLVATKVGADVPDAFEKLFKYAWDEGHANGLHEILYWLDEIAGIIRLYTGKGILYKWAEK